MGSGAQSNPVGSVYQQWLATRLSGTTYGPLFSLVADRDDGLPYVLGDLRVSQFVLTVAKNEIVKCAFQIGGVRCASQKS